MASTRKHRQPFQPNPDQARLVDAVMRAWRAGDPVADLLLIARQAGVPIRYLAEATGMSRDKVHRLTGRLYGPHGIDWKDTPR